MSFKELFKKYRNKSKIIKFLWNAILIVDSSIIKRISFYLKCGFSYLFSGRAKQLQKYHNKYVGKRCFIVATGPSLTYEDLNLIKDEYSFSMNSIVRAFEKTEWRPTFYGIQDEDVYDKVEKDLLNSGLKDVFISHTIANKYSVPNEWNIFFLDRLNQRVLAEFYDNYYTRFSKNFAYKAYNGYTITYSLIQLAYYMGFTEIYLLGCDCNYSKDGKQHFIEHGHFDPTFEKSKDRMLVSYKKACEFASAQGMKIYNATRGGMLEIFPRVQLEDVIK